MSWHYLQEQEEASWEENSLDGAPSVLLNLLNIPDVFYSQDKETEYSIDSQSGMMLEHSMGSRGKEKLISSQEDSPARISVQLEMEKDLMEKEVDCGQKCPESLAKYDPVTRSLKTAQCLLFEDSTECLQILPKWGMIQNGELYPLKILEPLIEDNEFGYCAENFPTPCCFDFTNIQKHRKGTNLKNGIGRHSTSLPQVLGGSVNPNWSEWLMGWPIGWTDLKPLGMDKYQEWLDLHGKY